MPIVGLGLHILIALYFAVHAMRTGRNMYWLIILFSFPLLGSVVYFVVEMLPELRNSRSVRNAGHALGQLLNPERELNEAQAAFELSPTANNRARLANALLARGNAAAAIEHFRASLQGVHANDPALLLGYAQALFDNDNLPEACRALEQLRGNKERLPTQDSHLLYARALAASGEKAKARDQYDRLIAYYAGPEARCRYAAWLADEGDAERALALYREVANEARLMKGHYRSLHAHWLRQAEQALAQAR
jgi:hypothetical protein